jgi:hypothetical protein
MSILACPSSRFVEHGQSPLPENLSALWGRDPELASRVEASSAEPPQFETSLARDGNPTLLIRGDGGRAVQLHSRYEPLAEAAKLVDRLPSHDGLVHFVFGFGLGYHVEALLARVPTTARVWILEPDPAVIRAASQSRDLTKLYDNNRVQFISVIDRPKLLGELQSLVALISGGVTVLEHAPSVQRSPPFFADAKAWLEELGAFARTTIQTLVLNSSRTLSNIAKNLPWYAATPGPQRLAGAFRGEPAIIVSAGPSLRKNQHLLHEAKGKAVIIAVQTMLKPLLEMGIEPDFVTSLDYSEISTRFFRDLPPNLKTELVAEAKTTDSLFTLHTGPLTLIGNEMADAITFEAARPRTRLRAGATVAHLAFYLAEHLGCDPIVFVGQDLGFGDGLCYAPGTSYDDVWRPELGRFCTFEMKQWEQIARERPILRQVPDHRGRPMYTEQRLFTYLQQFERDFANSKARIIDATEGGASKRGATCTTLRGVLDIFCRKPLHGRVPPHPGLSTMHLAATRIAITRRIDDARAIASIANRVAPLLEEIHDHLDDQPRVNRAIARIDPLREAMNNLGRSYDLIMYLTQKTELERFKADMAIDGSGATSSDLQRRQAQRDLDNVRSVANAAAAFEATMHASLTAFDAFEAERGMAK